MRSDDTDPEAERVQLQLLRNATVAERVSLARSLTRVALQLAWRAIEEAHQSADRDEIAVRFVAHCYGATLADDFGRNLLQRRARRQP